MTGERRQHSGRITFRMPRAATFGSHKVVLSDLGSSGAGIRHREQIAPGAIDQLTFRLEREQHSIRCVLRRSRLELVDVGNKKAYIYHSGLQFAALEGSTVSIRNAIRKRVERALLRQRADAWADPSVMKGVDESSGSFSTDLLTSWMNARPFIRCRLDEKGRWEQERVDDSEQPERGFTISADEKEEDVALLRRTYEIASAEQKSLIRLFARLSIENPSDVPRTRFQP